MAGEVVHIELPSKDADRAQSFWSGLFGWSFGSAMEGIRPLEFGPSPLGM